MKTFTDAELKDIERADKYDLNGDLTPEDYKYVAVLERELQRLRHSLGIRNRKPKIKKSRRKCRKPEVKNEQSKSD